MPFSQVKKKMELEDFLRNNRGINGDGGDLPAEMLTTIFHEIVANEIKMKEDGEDWSKHSGMLTSKQRQQMWQDESDRIIRQSSNMFSKRSDTRQFNHANEKHHVSLMFKASWCPLLAAFSVIMEECDDATIVELVLRGFTAAVHIGSTFFMDEEREAFVSTLSKFTLLHTNHKQMKEKHVEAIKAILAIAFVEGDFLEDTWGTIQRTISQLDQKHLLLDGARDDASFFAGAADTPVRGAGAGASTAVRERVFLRCHLYIKMTILPRQARDKHKENSKKDAFLQVRADEDRPAWLRAELVRVRQL
jgi:brefeldin A-inhibited guanine nucleotide-exchange protein